MPQVIGYFEGTDAIVLTSLVCHGYATQPISNGADNHGTHILLLNQLNKPDVIVGYLHKVMAHEPAEADWPSADDIFLACRVLSVPLVLAVPEESLECAPQLFDDVPDVVTFTTPPELLQTVDNLLDDVVADD
ncbi:MAG: hypothetical protein HKN46_03490 [Acidimicrobiia bacterium]|nr:hypothetical protein [Acidimicrobiia bacterium]